MALVVEGIVPFRMSVMERKKELVTLEGPLLRDHGLIDYISRRSDLEGSVTQGSKEQGMRRPLNCCRVGAYLDARRM